MNLKKYYFETILITFFGIPIIIYFGMYALVINIPPIIPTVLLLCVLWFLYLKKNVLPEKASQIFLPIFLTFCYYMGVWIIVFGLSFDIGINHGIFSYIMIILTLPVIIINCFIDNIYKLNSYPIIYTILTIISTLFIIIICKIKKNKIIVDKKVIIYILIFVFLSSIAFLQLSNKKINTLNNDYQVERIEDEIDYYNYLPFSKNNKLKHLNEKPTIIFKENYPIIDGATAVYPVYGAIAQELYKGLNENTIEDYVTCTKTNVAYERLINGEIDIFFGAQPSEQQIQMAKEKGIEFILTPIAKEAFVFFVHKDNPVNSLTLEQIQDIYQKKIINWKNVGGKNEKILPFQRPKNSGSQTIMIAKVMGNKPLAELLMEEYAEDMSGIINQVAVYRNYTSAIGYSFRFFATGMNPNENIKLLAINGIEPTVENIRNGKYPFTIDVYAVTAGSQNENTAVLIDWILSEQGQNFIEICGYVRN